MKLKHYTDEHLVKQFPVHLTVECCKIMAVGITLWRCPTFHFDRGDRGPSFFGTGEITPQACICTVTTLDRTVARSQLFCWNRGDSEGNTVCALMHRYVSSAALGDSWGEHAWSAELGKTTVVVP